MINTIYKQLNALYTNAGYAIAKFRKWDIYNGLQYHKTIIPILDSLVQNPHLSEADRLELQNICERLLCYMELNDYIGLADVYQTDVERFCVRMKDVLHAQGIWAEFTDYYDRNYQAASDDIRKMLDEIHAEMEDVPESYRLLENAVGEYSLQIQEKTEQFRRLLCGTVNPYTDAMEWLTTYQNQQENPASYTVLGFEMGYLASVLVSQEDIQKISIFETDPYVLKAAFHYRDLTELLNTDKQLCIIYDPELIAFSKEISKQERAIMIQRNAIRNISSDVLRSKLEDFYIHQNSVVSQIKRLTGNFRRNIQEMSSQSLDELQNVFEGKDVVLVAAGPSLERNLHWLKEQKDYKIVCVGTVAKQLLQQGIYPDYIVMIDVAATMVNQMEGIDTSNENLIYLPTLYYGVVQQWKGSKYMGLQSGFDLAEQYAKHNDRQLYTSGGSVVTFAFDFLLRFHCRRIVCIGMDFAYVDNRRHSGEQEVVSDEIQNVRTVRDVHGNWIKTGVNLDNYRLWIENRLRIRTEAERQTEVINVSEGAYIHGMIHEIVEDL